MRGFLLPRGHLDLTRFLGVTLFGDMAPKVNNKAPPSAGGQQEDRRGAAVDNRTLQPSVWDPRQRAPLVNSAPLYYKGRASPAIPVRQARRWLLLHDPRVGGQPFPRRRAAVGQHCRAQEAVVSDGPQWSGRSSSLSSEPRHQALVAGQPREVIVQLSAVGQGTRGGGAAQVQARRHAPSFVGARRGGEAGGREGR